MWSGKRSITYNRTLCISGFGKRCKSGRNSRETQIPTRWIDQGANQALILAETPYRQLAGRDRGSVEGALYRQDQLAENAQKRV
jgi:hypothetical protein